MSRSRHKSNDYRELTVKYLRRYKTYKVMVESMSADIKDITADLASAGGLKAISYDDATGGGGGGTDVTPTEREAWRMLDLETERRELLKGVADIKGVLERIDRAMDSLTKDERELVELIHFERAGYGVATERCHYSERYCRKLLRDAEDAIALILFGPISEKQFQFIAHI